MSSNSKSEPFTDSTNNIHLRKNVKRRYLSPREEYRRVGFTEEELLLKTKEELIRMEWMLESPLYIDVPEIQKKSMLNDVLTLYGNLKYADFCAKYTPRPNQEYVSWIATKIKETGWQVFAIANESDDDADLLKQLKEKFHCKKVEKPTRGKDTLKNQNNAVLYIFSNNKAKLDEYHLEYLQTIGYETDGGF